MLDIGISNITDIQGMYYMNTLQLFIKTVQTVLRD